MKKNILRNFLIFNALQMSIIFAFYFFSQIQKSNFEPKSKLINRFLITDYCFTTESRHTRHFLFPEYLSAFQDLPAYHDHFPSSSFFWIKQ